jgi:hypothetical protein
MILFACKRKGEPIPSICTESAISAGDLVTMKLSDTLVLVNCSKNYTIQRWMMPDGGSSSSETVYFIPPYVDTFTVQLFVSNDHFVNEYKAIKRVAVIP